VVRSEGARVFSVWSCPSVYSMSAASGASMSATSKLEKSAAMLCAANVWLQMCGNNLRLRFMSLFLRHWLGNSLGGRLVHEADCGEAQKQVLPQMHTEPGALSLPALLAMLQATRSRSDMRIPPTTPSHDSLPRHPPTTPSSSVPPKQGSLR